MKNKKIYISINLMMDIKKRYGTNVIIDNIEFAEMTKIYFLISEEFKKTNIFTIDQLFSILR